MWPCNVGEHQKHSGNPGGTSPRCTVKTSAAAARQQNTHEYIWETFRGNAASSRSDTSASTDRLELRARVKIQHRSGCESKLWKRRRLVSQQEQELYLHNILNNLKSPSGAQLHLWCSCQAIPATSNWKTGRGSHWQPAADLVKCLLVLEKAELLCGAFNQKIYRWKR